MGITSFVSSSGSGFIDKVMKKSLLPTDVWKDDKAWTKDTYTSIVNNKIGMIPSDTVEMASNTTATQSSSSSTYYYGNTFTPTSTLYLKSITVKLLNSTTPEGNFTVKVMTLDANGNPDYNNVLAEAVLYPEDIIADNTARTYTLYFNNPIELTANTEYSFIQETTEHTVHYETTDVYAGGHMVGYNTSDGTYSHYNGSYDMYFTINGGTTFPASTSAYTDLDVTGDITALNKLSFTADTDGTNSVKFDLTDINGNIIKENVTPTTELSEYLDYDKLRLKVTLATNGSTNAPRITSYEVERVKKPGTGWETSTTDMVMYANGTNLTVTKATPISLYTITGKGIVTNMQFYNDVLYLSFYIVVDGVKIILGVEDGTSRRLPVKGSAFSAGGTLGGNLYENNGIFTFNESFEIGIMNNYSTDQTWNGNSPIFITYST